MCMETIKNLAKAFIGESQARNRYTFYAKVVQKEGFREIAERFAAIAVAEKHQEERYRKLLKEFEGNTIFKKDKKVY